VAGLQPTVLEADHPLRLKQLVNGKLTAVTPRGMMVMSASAEGEEEDEECPIAMFGKLAEMGELDFYTCICLKIATGSPATKSDLYKMVLTKLPAMVAMQFIVPMCLLKYQVKKFEFAAADTDLEFRVVGFIVYLYSVWNMYDNSFDECRAIYLKLMADMKLPTSYSLVAYMGEFINAFTGFSLVVTLFTVFVLSVDPFNLVINSIAINYLGNVDNEFVDETLKVESLAAFQKFERQHLGNQREESSEESEPRCDVQNWTYIIFTNAMQFVRVIGTLGLGHILAILLLLGHEKTLCPHEGWIPFEMPMCLDA